MILVTGFGPFGAVEDNPSGRLALALDGATAGGEPIVGRRLAVSWHRAPAETLAWAHRLQPRLILGFGVATSRDGVDVEAMAHPGGDGDTADADGVVRPRASGPPRAATIDPWGLARALDARISFDAGQYLCNGWLYHMVGALPGVPVGFVHIPPHGVDPARVLAALDSYLADHPPGTTHTWTQPTG